jgi:tRNA (Thr-GGU) A37 N-methylase
VEDGVIHILGCDLIDGTPVLDIKPYVPYCDAFPDSKAGWVDELDERDRG